MVGDFIVIADFSGTVKHIGLKTTRVQSLSGEGLVFANNDLLKSRVRNFKRMSERRIVFRFGIVYGTPAVALEALAEGLKTIVSQREKMRFDRAHFMGLGTSSLDFEVVYYMLVPDYSAYMDTQQAINLVLLEYCRERGITFAFPIQTLHMASVPVDLPAGSAREVSQSDGLPYIFLKLFLALPRGPDQGSCAAWRPVPDCATPERRFPAGSLLCGP